MKLQLPARVREQFRLLGRIGGSGCSERKLASCRINVARARAVLAEQRAKSKAAAK